jgi:DNA-binding transcriptional regulator YbjK
MRQRTGSALPEINVSTPNIARVYDYFLGGKDNYAADREAAEKVIAAAPYTPALTRANREFIQRAVRYSAETGVRQFIDVGSGLPTQENTHEVVRRVAPESRVVYVDNDPIVVSHGKALLATDNRTVVIQADMRRPIDILDHPHLRETIEWNQPVSVLLTAVLHFITHDEMSRQIIAQFRNRMPADSHIIISHVTAQDHAETCRHGADVYRQIVASTHTLRDRNQILTLFNGFDLIAPGLVPLPQWRPDLTPASARHLTTTPKGHRPPLPVWFLGGVGHKRAE